MRKRNQRLAFLVALSSQFSVAHSNSNDSNNIDEANSQYKECGIYLAQSTIPGAGLGMFAGSRHYKKKDLLTAGDLMVPVFEMDWHNGHDYYNFLWDEYTWSADLFQGMEDEIALFDEMSVISFGMGAAVNCMLPLVNAADSDNSISDSSGFDNAGVSSQSPGIGAFTPYHDRTFVATRDVLAGQEIFVNYGENYFMTRNKYQTVPLFDDYIKANEIISRFQKMTQQLSLSSSMIESLWKFVSTPTNWNRRPFYALPSNYTEAIDIMRLGGTAMLHFNKSIRSLEWLESNGECMDNIYDQVSTIPDAGRGAFARRFIPKGGVVSPAPLIHLPNRNVLTIYDGRVFDDDDDEIPVMHRDLEKPKHQQLILNYCFGHRDSSLLLCPYGLLTALINHSHKSPNTKIVWSQNDGMMGHPEWINQPLSKWGGQTKTGLSFDFVALRDIEASEEILIDYGSEWEEAWQQHVQTFEVARKKYIPAFELNQMEVLRVYTMSEYEYNSDGVLIFCRRNHILLAGIDIEEAEDWEVTTYGFNNDDDDDDAAHDLGIYPCRVVERHNDNSYLVELVEREEVEENNLLKQKERFTHILFDVPRDIFYFRDMVETRDHHQTWSFRHDMRIPDEMFPEEWRNMMMDTNGDDSLGLYESENSDNDEESESSDNDEKEDSNHECGIGEHGTCSTTPNKSKTVRSSKEHKTP